MGHLKPDQPAALSVHGGTVVAAVLPVIVLALLAAPLPAAAQSAAPVELEAACPAATAGARIRAATYVALGKGMLFRLQVERGLEGAQLLVNKVDGNRLYDRTYWKPTKVAARCGQRTIDYLEEEAPPAGPLRLVLEPAEEVRRPGLPRAMIVFTGVVILPTGERQPLQFEEVVVKREVGAPAAKRSP